LCIVLFYKPSTGGLLHCTKFYGLKIDEINNNLKSDSQTLHREPINKFDELLAGYQLNPSTEEEVDVILKGITSEAQSGDTDTDSEEINALAVAKLGRKRKAYNYSRKKIKGNPPSNYLESAPQHTEESSSPQERSKALSHDLACDALSIIEENANMQTRNATVCLCVVLRNRSGNAKKFVFHNGRRGLPGSMSDKAHNLHYHIVNAEQAHAEGEFIQFLLDRVKNNEESYTHILGMGCSRQHCQECDGLLKLSLGSNYPQFTAALRKTTNDKNEVKAVPQAGDELVVKRNQETVYKIVYGSEAISDTYYKKIYLPTLLREWCCKKIGKEPYPLSNRFTRFSSKNSQERQATKEEG
jgi:hypothetical protein